MLIKHPQLKRFAKAHPFTFLAIVAVLIGIQAYTQLNTSTQSLDTPPRVQGVDTTSTASARVVRVIDGDTIEIDTGHVVRYIGIDTPELKPKNGASECYASEAAAINEQLVMNKLVRLERDISETDRYGRLLRYVYVDTTFVNEYLVAQGYAHAATFPPDIRYKDVFVNAERGARLHLRGFWSPAECVKL